MLDLLENLRSALATRYTIERELGRGGMAVVYLARDLRHDRAVALKVLRPELGSVLGADRFLLEIRLLAKLQHPHILPLHDSGEAADCLFFVMPYVEGESLRARMRREGRLPVGDALQIAQEVAEGLAYAHERGVVHRDIKPENILLSGGHAVVADFGVARALSAAGADRLTETGAAVGTPAYMSPEQSLGERELDPRTDVYSLGCVLFEMLAGRSCFLDERGEIDYIRRFTERPLGLHDLCPEVPPEVETVATKALARLPDQRYTAAELVKALSHALKWVSVSTPQLPLEPLRPGGRVSEWARRRTAVVAAVALGLLLGLAGWIRWSGARTVIEAGGSVELSSVAVVPFTTTGAHDSLQHLGYAVPNRLAQHLDGEIGPRAVDRGSVLSAWKSRAGPREQERPLPDLLRLSKSVGATHLITGEIAGSPAQLEISASLHSVTSPNNKNVLRARARGTMAEHFALVDQLAIQLLALTTGQAEERLDLLTRSTLISVKAYLRGEQAFRAGRWEEAAKHYTEALAADSSHVLAAIGLASASSWLPDRYDDWELGVRMAWSRKYLLPSRDRQHLVARAGAAYPGRASFERSYDAWARAADANPDRPDIIFEVGDELFHRGRLISDDNPLGRAELEFLRALKLDSSFSPALEHLLELSVIARDTALIRRRAEVYFRHDSISDHADFFRWRVAIATGDSLGLADFRSRLSEMPEEILHRIVATAQLDGRGLPDASLASRALERQARSEPRSKRLYAALHALQLNRGRPGDAVATIQRLQGLPNERPAPQVYVLHHLYWDGDSTAAAAAARQLVARLQASDRSATGARERHQMLCVIEQWRLRQGDRGSVHRTIAELRRAASTDSTAPVSEHASCAALLKALVEADGANAASATRQLDSLMRREGSYLPTHTLVLARLRARQGDAQGALRTVRRRLFHTTGGAELYLSSLLREEGRLAVVAGDKAGALRAYEHYLALRSDPEPTLVAQRDSVQAEYARLGGAALQRASVARER